MLAAVLTVALAAPGVASPSPPADQWELGPLWLEQGTKLTWPGLYMPSFRLATDRRRVHRLTLGLDVPALRGWSFDAVVVEASDDLGLRARTTRLQRNEGAKTYAWVGARVQIPKSQWQLGLGYATVLRVASGLAGVATGRALGEWRVNLLRPLR